MIAYVLLVLRAEAGAVRMPREHRLPAVALVPVAANEAALPFAQVAKARNVEAAGPAVLDRVLLADELLHETGDAGAHHVLTEVVADVTARVADSVWMLLRLRKQEQASGLQRGRGEDDDLGLCLVGLVRCTVNERDPARASRVAVHQNLVRSGVRAQREVAGVHRRVDESCGRVERGVNVTATRAPIARPSAVALAAILVVLDAIGGDARAIRREHAAHRRQLLSQRHLAGVELRGALEEAVGQMRQILLVAGDAEVAVDAVVIRLDVLVGDRPILAIAVMRLRLEVVVGQTQCETSPDVRLAAERACTHPRVRGAGVGMFLFVYENVLDVVGSSPPSDVRVHVLVRAVGRVRSRTNRILVHGQRMPSRRRVASAGMVVRPLHRAQLLLDGQLLPCLEQEHFHALRRQHVRRHAAGRAGADDDGVVRRGEVCFGRFWRRCDDERHRAGLNTMLRYSIGP